MRRFFIVLFVLSLLATAAAVYWQTYLPEASVPASANRQFSTREVAPGQEAPAPGPLRASARQPSDRQNMAVTISILSSIISAVAAIAQTWLTARAYRR